MINLKPTKFDAISSLVGGGLSGADDGTQMEYRGKTPPTKEAIDTKYAVMISEWTAQEYARNRASAYPSLADQADMQYHDQINGTTTWKDAIAKVKSDNPKE